MEEATQPQVVPVWPAGVPDAPGWPPQQTQQQEQEDLVAAHFNLRLVRNVTQPTLTAFLPPPTVATGTAVIVAPGGAFHFLAIEHEGTQVAEWLTARGVAAFVLRYRLVPTAADEESFLRQVRENLSQRHVMRELTRQIGPLAIADGQQAIRVVRERASGWGLASERIGMMGFSAGGVVTTGAALEYDAASRPSFAAPIYGAPWEGSAVPADAPPLFIAVANDDPFAAQVSVPLPPGRPPAGLSSCTSMHGAATASVCAGRACPWMGGSTVSARGCRIRASCRDRQGAMSIDGAIITCASTPAHRRAPRDSHRT